MAQRERFQVERTYAGTDAFSSVMGFARLGDAIRWARREAVHNPRYDYAVWDDDDGDTVWAA